MWTELSAYLHYILNAPHVLQQMYLKRTDIVLVYQGIM